MRRALLILALLPLPAFAQDEEEGGGFLENLIEENLSGSGREVNVRGFEGALSSRATIAEITIADSEGVWLRVENAVLDWNRSALLRRRLEVTELSAESIEVLRRPVAEASAPSPEAQGFSLPELPVSIEIEELHVDSVSLGEGILGEAATVSLDGAVALAGGEGSADLTVERIDGESGRLVLDTAYANETRVLDLVLSLEEGPDGLVANAIDLPGRPSVALDVEGAGPLSDFEAQIRLATYGEERLAGQFALVEADGARRFRTDIGGNIAPVFLPEYQAFFGPDVRLVVAGEQAPDGRLTLEDLALTAQALTLRGDVEIGADGLPDRVALTGRVASPDGGPVLLPVQGAETRVGSVTLDVAFDASVGEDWTAELAVADLDRAGFSAERLTLEGIGRIGDAPERAVTAAFDFAATALDLGDPRAAEALGETVTGRAEIAWQEGQPVEVSLLRLDGESYGLVASGEVRGLDSALTLAGEARVEARDLSAFAGVAGRPLSGAAEARLAGEGEVLGGRFDLTLDASGTDIAGVHPRVDPLLAGAATAQLSALRDENGTTIRRFAVETPEVTTSGEGVIATGASRLTLDARLADLALVEPSLAGPATVSLQAAEEGEDWRFDVAAEGAGATATAAGVASDLTGTPSVEGTLEAQVADLSPFSALARRPLGGALEATLEGGGRIDLAQLDIVLDAAGQDLEVGFEGTAPVLAGRSTLSLSASRSGDIADIRRLRATAAGLEAEGTGALTALSTTPVFDGQMRIAADDLAPLSELARRDLGGALAARASGRIAANLATLDLTLDATGSGLTLGLPGEEELLPGEARLAGRVVRDGATARLDDVRLTSENLRATVAGTLEGLDAVPVFDGSATLAADDLTPLSGLVGRPFAGSIGAEAEGRVALDLSQADIVLLANATDLVPGLAGAEGLLPGATSLEVRAARDADTATIEALRLSNENLSAEAAGTITGLPEAPVFDGRVSLDAANIAPLSGAAGRALSGSVSAEAEGDLALDLATFDLAVSAEADLLRVGQADADRLLAGTARLTVDAARAGERIEVRQAEVVSDALRASVSGTIGDGTGDSRLTVDARLADIAPYAPGFSGPVTVAGTVADAPGPAYRIDLSGEGPGGISANAAGTVLRDFSRLDIALDGAAPLGLANRALEPRSLAGTLAFDLRVEGPPALQSVSGQLTSGNARLVAPELGFVLDDIDLSVGLGGGRATVTADAAVQGGGRLRLTGPVTLSAPFDANLRAEFAGVAVSDPELYTTTVSGAVTVSGPLAGGARIGGDLALGETEIRVPSTGLGGTFAIPDITHVNTPAPVARTLARAGEDQQAEAGDSGGGGGGRPYPLDLTIRAENRVFIRGRGLDAELGGALRLTGTTADVVPAGQFDLVRGRLDILGQRLTLDEGSVTLQGDFVPYVRLVARTEAGDVVVIILIEGVASAPDISFLSQPELPEEEVLAQLLFGRSLENISPLQAAQLASAVATLAGRGGGGIMERLRTGFGLDDFDVTTGEDGGLAVRAGAYLSENVYTDVTLGAQGQTEVNINLDLSESTSVKGTLGSEGDSRLGIYYERDY